MPELGTFDHSVEGGGLRHTARVDFDINVKVKGIWSIQ